MKLREARSRLLEELLSLEKDLRQLIALAKEIQEAERKRQPKLTKAIRTALREYVTKRDADTKAMNERWYGSRTEAQRRAYLRSRLEEKRKRRPEPKPRQRRDDAWEVEVN